MFEQCRRTDIGSAARRCSVLPARRGFGYGALLSLVYAVPAWSQAHADDQSRGEAALDAFLANIETLTADFRQELWTADQRLLETSEGSLALQRPNHFLWRSRRADDRRDRGEEPGGLLVVANGETLWTYDVELEQATRAPIEGSAAASPATLLSGDASVREQYDVVRDFTLDGLNWVELEPNVEGSDFTSVRIGFKDDVPEELELIDGLNQVTRVDLSNVEVNPTLPADTFEFEPPPNVDVLGAE